MSNQKRRLAFVQMDVFTRVPLEGNQLAVFTDARGLTDAEMQAIARETNLSETTFIFPGVAQQPISLESPVGEGEDSRLGDFIQDTAGVSPADAMIRVNLQEQTASVLGTLNPREEQIIKRRFGLEDGPEHTLEEDTAAERERGVRVRIFTTTEELPFAGHPTLGTAMVLHNKSGAEEVALDLKVGRIPVSFSTRDNLPFGVMTQRDPEFGQIHAREDIVRAAGVAVDDIAADVPIQTVTTGNPFVMIPVKSLAVLQNLTPTWSNMKAYLEKTEARFFYFVSREAQNPEAKMQSRMIFYNGEDPATGSAAGPCIAWAVKYGIVPPDQQVLLEQGVEMKRRSRIFLSASRDGEKVFNVRVGGHAVEVVRGELFL
jgi:trans-2,3-dihydro-3-hydroxyanthranilate isomerase